VSYCAQSSDNISVGDILSPNRRQTKKEHEFYFTTIDNEYSTPEKHTAAQSMIVNTTTASDL